MRVVFEKLEQRIGTHRVPVALSREELETTAQRMAEINTNVEALEDNLKEYSKDIRDQVKTLESERHDVTTTYRNRKEPRETEGLWGFDFDDKGKVFCATCAVEASKDDATGTADLVEDEAQLRTAHDGDGAYVGDAHKIKIAFERPLGTKWFVRPSTGEYWGPADIEETDLQKTIPPDFKTIEPFKLTIDTSGEGAVVMSADEVSKAQAMIDEQVAADEHAGPQQDLTTNCIDCGLPLEIHPFDAEGVDACKEAMVRSANEQHADQMKRTSQKYGADPEAGLDPKSTYPCGACGVETFGRDLQMATIEGEQKAICFACESNVTKSSDGNGKTQKKRKGKKSNEASA